MPLLITNSDLVEDFLQRKIVVIFSKYHNFEEKLLLSF